MHESLTTMLREDVCATLQDQRAILPAVSHGPRPDPAAVHLARPGTEWLDDAQVNRKGLGQGENRKMAGPEATVYAAQPFQIMRLKGDAGFGTNSPGIVHRSPAVPASLDGRWYLRVNSLSIDRSALRKWSRL